MKFMAAGREVFLDISVKVAPKWRKNDALLEQYGY
jgi:GTPase Era involved in 16S rRNA processing